MLTTAIFALALTAAAPPETPANLPVPAQPIVESKSQGQLNFSLKYCETSGSVQESLQKSLKVLSQLKGFQCGEIASEGVVSGYTDTRRVVLLAVPRRETCLVYAMMASCIPGEASTQEMEQFGVDLVIRIEKATVDSTTPKKLGTQNLELEKKLPPIFWDIETKPSLRLTQHFGGIAGVVLEKKGYNTTVLPLRGEEGAAFGEMSTAKTKVAVISMMPCVNGISKNFLVFCSGPDATKKEAKDINSALLKILYE